jgi:ribosomal protein S18 acetylase RimI-like enzyme
MSKMGTLTSLTPRNYLYLLNYVNGVRSYWLLLGMAIFVPSTSPACQVAELGEAEIHLLAVYPEARCQGIASRLIKACEEQAVSLGYSKMVLSTEQTMREAHRIYEQLDYRRNSTRDWSKGENKIYFVYEKILQT